MYRLIDRLIIYKASKDSILYCLADVIKKLDAEDIPMDAAINEVFCQVNRLLLLASEYGFDKDLWHNYLAYVIAVSENPFSLYAEREDIKEATLNHFAKSDFEIFKQLFEYDFKPLEDRFNINCFTMIKNYHMADLSCKSHNRNAGEKIKALSSRISCAEDDKAVFYVITDFYKRYGTGRYGLNKAFRIVNDENTVNLVPIINTHHVSFDDIIGYTYQKEMLIKNTESFINGKNANNVLLFGDSGTGKSTCVKAVLNEYDDRGIRMIELYKHQFCHLSSIISMIKNRNYRFIIYMDDLSFEDFEIEYKYLKAVIEGGLETRPDNVLIYATSNRRHLIRETWSDRTDMSKDELHRSDTVQEKLSLAARFGISIHFSSPNKKEFYEIVRMLAMKHNEITLTEDELYAEASRWEMSHGGMSGRTAAQFITHLSNVLT